MATSQRPAAEAAATPAARKTTGAGRTTARKQTGTRKQGARKQTGTGKQTARKQTEGKQTGTREQTAGKQTGTRNQAGTAERGTAERTAAGPAGRRTTPLLERDPVTLLQDTGYALAGVTADAVERLGGLRARAPEQVRATVHELRTRVVRDLEDRRAGLARALDARAEEGRRVTDGLRTDERVQRVLEQTGTARSQVKGAITSLRRTVDVAAEAARPGDAGSAGEAGDADGRDDAGTPTDAA